MESDGDSVLENHLAGVNVGNGEARLVEDHGLTKTIEITPLQVGKLHLAVFVSYLDGGISRKGFELDVVPSDTGVKAFHLDAGFAVIPLEIGGRPEASQHWLAPEAQYDRLDYPIRLKDSSSITMVVDQPEDNPVIRLDGNGLVHALRPGRAKITGRFAGLEDTVEVDVRAH
ncbi:MAG: hypothetical protein ACLGSD_13110 [Acidobacteriota bacterium]